jgi:hypothetical protein
MGSVVSIPVVKATMTVIEREVSIPVVKEVPLGGFMAENDTSSSRDFIRLVTFRVSDLKRS